MKPHRLTAYILLFVLMQVDKRREIWSCGQLKTTLAPSITNSFETHRWPWHVGIYHRVSESKSEYACGGTLISPVLILTAAHCVMVAPQHISVALGKLTLDGNETTGSLIEVAEVIQHPQYYQEYLRNDIAIIRLNESAMFNNYVQPVCLWMAYKTDLSEIINKSGTVVGWGLTETGKVSNTLRRASMPVVDSFTCLESNRDLFGQFLSNTNYCAGSQNGTSVCSGDSGGSMTFEENGVYYIRGIVSLSPTSLNRTTQSLFCDSSQYAVFTDVAKYLEWINERQNSTWIDDTTIECSTKVRCWTR